MRLGRLSLMVALLALGGCSADSELPFLGAPEGDAAADDSLVAQAGDAAREEVAMKEWQAERQSLIARQQALQAKFEALEERVSGLGASARARKRELAELSERVATLENTADQLTQGPTSGALQSRQQAILNRLDSLRTRLADAMDRIASLEGVAEAQGEVVGEQAKEVMKALGQDVDVQQVTDYGVHLISYRAREDAVAEWETLRQEHGDLFEGLSARIDTVRLDDFGGRYYQLLVGPFDDAAAASRLCSRARSRELFCEVQEFGGEPL